MAGARPDAPGTGTLHTRAGTLRLATGTHPHLADHAVAGTPVLPLALALEWFLGTTREHLPDGPPMLRAVEVVRGVALPDLAGRGRDLTVGVTADEGALSLTLDSDRWTRYRARA